MFISSKHNYKPFSKSPPASLLPLLVFHVVQAFGTVKGLLYLINNKNKCVSFKFKKFFFSQ